MKSIAYYEYKIKGRGRLENVVTRHLKDCNIIESFQLNDSVNITMVCPNKERVYELMNILGIPIEEIEIRKIVEDNRISLLRNNRIEELSVGVRYSITVGGNTGIVVHLLMDNY